MARAVDCEGRRQAGPEGKRQHPALTMLGIAGIVHSWHLAFGTCLPAGRFDIRHLNEVSYMNRLTRRDFLKAAGISAAVAAVAPALLRGAAATGAPGKPNILVIMSDEHNASVMGCAGNKIVRTPNLDGLAARGVLFDACYTNSPLCVPCRLSFTAGKYASRVSAWNNDCWLPSDDIPSIARVMNDAGYFSGLCGKMHYDATRRYGFTDVGGNMNKTPKTGHGGRRDPDDLAEKPGYSGRFDQFHPGDGGVQPHDLAVTKGTVEFLKSWKPIFRLIRALFLIGLFVVAAVLVINWGGGLDALQKSPLDWFRTILKSIYSIIASIANVFKIP